VKKISDTKMKLFQAKVITIMKEVSFISQSIKRALKNSLTYTFLGGLVGSISIVRAEISHRRRQMRLTVTTIFWLV